MTTVRRLQAAAAVTAAILAATCWQVGSTASSRRTGDAWAGVAKSSAPTAVFDSAGLFAERPLITYSGAPGATYFALQLKPNLGAVEPRPRDIVVMIDTSASQAGKPLQDARLLVEQIMKKAGPDDRIAVWTVNTPAETKDLGKGLLPANDRQLYDGLLTLEKVVYAAGATDLKGGFKKVLATVNPTPGRHTSLLYIGDGKSALEPLTDADRSNIAAELVDRQIPLFTVPQGKRLHAKSLHGLSAATGGTVIRPMTTERPAEAAARVLAATDVPVLYPTKVEYSESVVEALPTRLPPLRSDSPVLVAGQLKGAQAVSCRIDGHVNGKPRAVVVNETPAGPEAQNFFLINMVRQWRESDRSAPAIMRSDRGLALAFEQTRLARDEFLAQAEWAVGLNKLDAAENLFKAAKEVDPQHGEALAGLKVVSRLKSGEITHAELFKDADANAGNVRMNIAAQGPSTPPVDPVPGGNLLDLERRRRAVQEQQITQSVDETIRLARERVTSEPEFAYDVLKRQLDSVRNAGELSESVRATLANRLEASLRTIQAEGARVRLAREAELQSRMLADARRRAEAGRANEDERIRERVRTFNTLMDQARFELAYREADIFRQELVSRGRAVPPQVQANYQMAINANYVRLHEEIRRDKEAKILLTMLQVDKSHVPFPDEPPVVFPPAEVWRRLTDERKGRYESESLGGYSSKAARLKLKLNEPSRIEQSFDSPLRQVLNEIERLHEVTILINPAPFREAGKERVEEQVVRVGRLSGVSLSTYLAYVLSQIDGTFLVKKDYIEVTTRRAAGLEKVIRAFPVADLVIPIPNAVDQNSLQQSLQLLGGSLSANGQAIFGSVGGGLNLGNFGALGGQIGVVGGGALGALGALGAGGGGQGLLGGGTQGFQGGALGFAGGSGGTNLGFGGGVTGFGGGQQGQFGNLGGQFGLQGGDTSFLLIDLISNIIAPKEWNTRASMILAQNSMQRVDDEDLPTIDISLLNAMQYYQPARALVVRGSARIHNKAGDFSTEAKPPGAAAPLNRGGDVIVFEKGNQGKGDPKVAAAPKAKPDGEPKVPVDPKTIWQEQMASGTMMPRNVVAVADLLAVCLKFDHAAELLKADLRQGIVADDAIFDALAVALEGSKASVEEIERVRLSKIDLNPESAESFLETAQAMADLGRVDKGLELCRRAAALEPTWADPYHKALALAQQSDTASIETIKWAAANLLNREWDADAAAYQQQAKIAVEQLANRLTKQGKADQAESLRSVAAQGRERDLVVELIWSDPADLDLTVKEPTGTSCSVWQPRTPAGGAWDGDRFSQSRESYTAAQAFKGAYELAVRRVWGEPLGHKATIKVTKHQGTPQETVELHTVALDSNGNGTVKLQLDSGRRTATESVPVTGFARRAPLPRISRDEVYAQLRAAADPYASSIRPPRKEDAKSRSSLLETGGELSHQTNVASAVSSGVDLLTSTTISSDRRTMKISFNPAFNGAKLQPRVPVAAVPGGN